MNAPASSRSIALNRRVFLQSCAVTVGAGLAAKLPSSTWAQPTGANGDIRVGVVGVGRKGSAHVRALAAMTGVRVVALCDVDPQHVAAQVEELKKKQTTVFATTDARQLFERPDVDAVVIASSNHWHALHTIWACQAGKDVYVEKPVCHTVGEGGQMLAAAARYGRIVAAGTQSRSDPGIAEAVEYVRQGRLGRIQWIHALCYRLRESIGRKLPWYPDGLDFDRYCGPAAMVPLERNHLHYDWHWQWNTGGGDLANIGVHQLDIARKFAGDPPFPPRVLTFGGRFAVNDAGETPNTALAVYAFPEFPVLFEVRGRPTKPGVKAMDQYRGTREGVMVQCEGGHFVGYVGGAAYDHAGKRIKEFKGDGGGGHMANFLAAVRSRRAGTLTAPLRIGRDSSVCCLLSNISYRIGAPAGLPAVQRQLTDFPMATDALKRIQDHLAVHRVDLARTPLTLGHWLEIDRDSAAIVNVTGAEPTILERARFLCRGAQRPPYIIPAEFS